MQSNAPCRICAAASLSTRASRRLRVAADSRKTCPTAFVEYLSSHNKNGKPNPRPRRWARSRDDIAFDPTVPLICSGSPIIRAPMSCSATTALKLSSVAASFPRRKTVSGDAIVSETSDNAKPICFSPGSTPRSLCPRPIFPIRASKSRIFGSFLLSCNIMNSITQAAR